MSDEFGKLKEDYQDIRAPQHLATRIRAEVADRAPLRRSWLPALATTAVAVVVIGVTPLVLQQQTGETVIPKTPSMSTLARLKPDKPAVTAPSLSRVRSVKTPALPPRPKLSGPNKPQSYFEIRNDELKETHHV